MLEIQQDARLPLSDQDVEDILKLAEQQGIDEPILIRSGTEFVIQTQLGVIVAERPQEDTREQIRTYRYLFLEAITEADTNRDAVGDWQLGQWLPNRDDPWMEFSRRFVRFGEELWEFTAERGVDVAEARAAWIAYATGDLIFADGVELPRTRAPHWQGWLGMTRTKGAGMMSHSLAPGAPELDWDLQLWLPSIPCTSAELALKRVGKDWHVVMSW
jgi:hypothetical protein